MSSDKQVLLVDAVGGPLGFVADQLGELGFQVIWVPTLNAALEFLEARPQLALIIASSAATQVGGLDFLGRVRELLPEVRVIWGSASSSGRAASTPREKPDSLLPEPFRKDELRAAISELLSDHFYPPPIAEAVKSAALEILGSVGGFQVEGSGFLAGNRVALSDLTAVIPFTGGVSGHLMVGLASADARALYSALLPHVRQISVERMEDLVGEICNQILGRINVYFLERSVSIQHGTPIFIRAAGSTLRYPGRQPSFAVTVARPGIRLGIEYYLAQFEHQKLHAPVTTRVLKAGEIRYL